MRAVVVDLATEDCLVYYMGLTSPVDITTVVRVEVDLATEDSLVYYMGLTSPERKNTSCEQ